MPAPQISPLPTPPSRSQSPETFSVDADAFLGAFPDFQTEANAQADYLDDLAVDVTADSAAAEAAAAIAAGAANYQGDYSAGTTYQIGESVSYNGRRYVAKTVNTGVTPADGANWFLINDGDVLGPISATNNGLAAFDGTTGKLIKAAGTVGVAQGGTGATSLTANAVLVGNGTSAISSVAPSTAGNLLTSNGTSWVSQAAPAQGSSLTAIASGSMADGSTVVVNADGTVSIVSGETQLLGSLTTYTANNANTGTIFGTYDENAQRVVICYADSSNSSFGTAVVGTVSGMGITFGTPVVFNSANSSQTMHLAYHAGAQKIVIAYSNGSSSNRPTAIVGTVSGTTISFGTAVQFGTGVNTANMNVVYHSQQQRIFIAYRESSSNLYGIVATVTGTVISFGSATSFNVNASGIGMNNGAALLYHPIANRIVISYLDGSTAYIVAVEVVSLAMGFGTPETPNSNNSTPVMAYDSVQNRIIFAHTSGSSPFPRFVRFATLSGFTFTFAGTQIDVSASISSISFVTYDANARRVLFSSRNGTQLELTAATTSGNTITFFPKVIVNANAGTQPFVNIPSINRFVVFATDGVTLARQVAVFRNQFSNLTSSNFIGFSNGSFTNGQTATVQLVGAVDDAQTGLTAGSAYYVQLSGGIGLTPSDPSIFAGTAVTASRIIVKG
jgi:hypothetical protein